MAALGLLAGAAWATAAPAHDLPADYLPGSWAVGSVDACSGEAGEKLAFAADGTFEETLRGEATAVGFWHLAEDRLDLHMVTSPAFFDDPATSADDALAAQAGQYTYYFAKGLMFDIEPDAFRMVATLGDQMRGADLFRCS